MAFELQKKTYSVHIRFFYGSCRTASSAKSEILPHLPYAGLEHRGAFPPRARAAAGMRVTEVRKAGSSDRCRPERNIYDAGGQVCSITGERDGKPYTYVADIGHDTRYVYGADALGAEGTLDNNFQLRKRRACATYGNRAAKWTATKSSETLYFNTMWTWHTDTGLRDGQYSKHIYLGETRVVTKQTSKLEASYGQSDEWHHQYYYHPDHLGSAQLVTDYEGNEYQRIEYTPYGELWVEKKTEKEEGLRYLPYKFTAKEQDEETGLYYYGARYLDAKYSRWMSTDPAVSDYINGNSTSGGLYNTVNFNLYHYAGNNPIKYIDPDGRETSDEIMEQINKLQAEMVDCQDKGGEISPEQLSMFMDLAGQYNNAVIAEGKLSKDDYVSGGRITTEFEEAQDAVGNYQVNLHSGIDIVGGELKSPFFMLAVNGEETGSNGKVFKIIGTDLRMNVLHGDAGSVKKSGDFFKPGDTIMPFPKKNNFRLASTGPHFHIELSNGTNYVNPFTLKVSSSEFKRTTDGGKSWKTVKPNF